MPFVTEADLLAAAESRQAEEGDHLELKRELPPGNAGNSEIAKDLAAMARGGGVILVGVDEGPPPRLTPIQLAGQRERVEARAREVDPPVPCQVRVIRRDPPNEATGYLVITVPVSEDAPHAVNFKFYGRFGTLSSPMKHEEVRRAFQEAAARPRYQGATTVERGPAVDELLDRWVQEDPTPDDQRTQAHIFVVARPYEANPQMLQSAVGTDWEVWSRRAIVDGRDRLDREWSPDVGAIGGWRRVPDGWRGTTDHGPWQANPELRETHWLDLDLREDGTVRLFCGRGSDYYQGTRVIMEVIAGGVVRRALEAARAVTQATQYEGDWHVGVALTNLAGAVSYFRLANWWVDAEDLPPYPETTYRRSWAGTASEFVQDIDTVVEHLVGPLNRTLNEGRFQLPGPPRPPEPEEDEPAPSW